MMDNISARYTGGPITISATTVQSTLPSLSSLDLDTLRMQALPILTGWALASPLGDGASECARSV